MNFEKVVEDITYHHWNVHGMEVYKRAELLHSFGDTHSKYPIYSATKTILSIAVGIAIDQGKIEIEKNILEYIPEKYTRKMSVQQKESFQKLTLYRLMTMSVAGFPFRPEGDSYMDFSLSYPIKNPEEQVFSYSNIPAYLVGAALTEALGEDAWEFIEEKILKPLGISKAECTRCPDGYFYGASGMQMSVHDLSQIGILLYQKGIYGKERIVSEEYIQKATSALQMNEEGGYGYFIWKYLDGFSINGKWKQRCLILPDKDLVITYLSDIRDDSNDLRKSIEKWLCIAP